MDSIATSARSLERASRESAGPVAPESRIFEVDLVRGFALFGVLLVNMYSFGADSLAWISLSDRLAYAGMHVFFESKSWTLLAMLFGVGFALQLERAEARQYSILPVYLRRLFVLFAVGAAHTVLYDGDILMLFAELGLGLLLVRRGSTRSFLLLGAGLLLVFPLVRLASAPERSARGNEIRKARVQLERAQRSDVYAVGSFAEVAAENATAIPADPLEDIDTPESGLAVFAMLLFGFSVGRSRVLNEIPRHRAAFERLRAWGLGVGLAAMAVERVLSATAGYEAFRTQRAGPGIQLAGDLLFALATPALALGCAAALVLVAQSPRGRTAVAPLAEVGRLALSVYLMQTVMFTTLFYGYGFGQAYRLGPLAVTGWAVALFALQVLACRWWSRHFLFGPMEWLWRSATYLKWQPLRLPSASTR